MNLFNDQYLSIELEKDSNVFKVQWSDAQIPEKEFKERGLKLARFSQKHKPSGMLMNVRYMNFIWSMDIQQWYNKNVIKTQVTAGVQFVAIIINPDLMTQLSIEQTMDGNEGSRQFTKYFASEKEAYNWLTNSNEQDGKSNGRPIGK